MGSVISSSSISLGLLICYLTTVTSAQDNQLRHCYEKSAPLYGPKRCCYSARDWYIPSQSLCCGGKITRLDVTKHECCGDHIINTTEQICCDGAPHPIIDPDSGKKRDTCCWGTGAVYTHKTDKCCPDSNEKYTLRIAKPEEELQCCLGTPFDKNDSSVTCDFRTGLVSMCGGIPFDAKADSCCRGTLIKGYPSSVANRACCGNKSYNTDDEKCCMEDPSVIPFTIYKERECCGNTSYDPKSQICCRSRVLEREKYENCRTAIKLEFGCGGKILGPNEECCKKSGATRHSIIETPYNTATDQCCGGTIVPKSAECCGGEPIKIEERDDCICCRRSHRTRRGGPDHNACCKAYPTDKYDTAPRYTSYNSATMICTKGKPMPKSSEHQQYCGGSPLKPEKLCCRGQQHDKRSSKTQCCGTKSFNYEFEMCCKGRVGTQEEHVCCYDGLKNKNKLHRHCKKVAETQKYCQGRPYDSSRNTCGTQGEIYEKTDEEFVAHNEVIKPKPESPRLRQCKWCKGTAVNGTKWKKAWTKGICQKKYVVSVQITSQMSGKNGAAKANVKDNDIRKSKKKNTYRPDFFETANASTIAVEASSCQCPDIFEQNRELIIMTDSLIEQNGSIDLNNRDIVIENEKIIRKKIKRKMRRRGRERCERVLRRRSRS